MKISIITVVRNAENTIADTLNSVAQQTYENIEHIVIDGASTDKTLAIIKEFQNQISVLVSEPDNGIYDAMNKGIKLCNGDVIGLLNSDDVFQDETVVQQIVDAHKDPSLDACYANLVYVKNNDIAHVVRHWLSRSYRQGLCFKGWMPAHPTLYLKKHVYHTVGFYNASLAYQADLEFCARAFEIHNITSRFIPKLWVRMRAGGVTNNRLQDILKGNWESYVALKNLGLTRGPVNYFFIKWGGKIPQFLPSFLVRLIK